MSLSTLLAVPTFVLSLCSDSTSLYVGAWSHHNDREFVQPGRLTNQDHDRVGVICKSGKHHIQVSKFENSFFRRAQAISYGQTFYQNNLLDFYWNVGLVTNYLHRENPIAPVLGTFGVRYTSKILNVEIETAGIVHILSLSIPLW